ncbi:MAG: hypothetical protein HKO79_14810 [Desulfobacterales bacterium]|nr:hypothetical protein [Deltaproteobacteria bacterium]NNL43755.1 hypothetical protein [Desulfobacterales bacterium]
MISCTQCNASLERENINRQELMPCPFCNSLLQVDIFPAMFRAIPAGKSGEVLLEKSEASCFYHPQKKATIVCSLCGRFLCDLCDVDLNEKHLCPSCLEKGRTKRKIISLEDQRTCYDRIALLIAIVPMLGFWLTILTAPIVVFITIRHWKSPGSIVRKTKIRFIVAFIIASLQIAGWTFFFTSLFV